MVTVELVNSECSVKFIDKLSRCVTLAVLGAPGEFEASDEDEDGESGGQCTLSQLMAASFGRWKLSEQCRNILDNFGSLDLARLR